MLRKCFATERAVMLRPAAITRHCAKGGGYGPGTLCRGRPSPSPFLPKPPVRSGHIDATAPGKRTAGGVDTSSSDVPCRSCGIRQSVNADPAAKFPAAPRTPTRRGVAGKAAVASGPSPPVVGVLEDTGNGDRNRRYWAFDVGSGGRFVAERRRARSFEIKVWQRAEDLLALVLPRGFPESVRLPYGSYAGWQFTGMAASAAAGVMSTQALLYAMGLGAGAIPLAATLNWAIKDGLGQLGGVAFSSLVNTRFDANPKLWRIVAAVSLDASMVLELLSPLAPAYFLPIASVANVGKNISFLAASASRAAIHHVLAAKGNLADITAKSGAQTILACMVGTGGGVALSTLLGSEWQDIIPACLCLSAVHLAANYVSVRRIGIPTFDSQRLELVADAIHENRGMPTPEDLAARESMVAHAFRQQLGLVNSPTVEVGSRLEEAVRDWGELEGLRRACDGLPFLLSVRGDLDSRTAEVHLLILEGCGAREVLAGSYVAFLARRVLVERGLRRGRRRGAVGRLAGAGRAPRGEILYDVITEALERGAAMPISPASPEGVLRADGQGRSLEGRELRVAREFVDRAERSGWDTSVNFLESSDAARLRLLHSEHEGCSGVDGGPE